MKNVGLQRRSLGDPDRRFPHHRKWLRLGYTATLAASEDHPIVELRVGQQRTDSQSLVPAVEAVVERCGQRSARLSANSSFFTLDHARALEARGIDAYAPNAVVACQTNTRRKVRGAPPRLGESGRRNELDRLRL